MTNRKKKACALLLGLIGLLLSTGCWDRVETNDIAISLASSLDLEPNGLYRYSVQMALPGQMGGPSGGGGGTSGTRSYYVDSDTGRTIREAVYKLQRRISREMIFSHRRVLVIGEDLARKGIRDLFDELARLPENRLTAYLIVARGKGYDMLNAQPKLERFSGEAIRELAQSKGIMKINLKTVAQDLSTPGIDPVLLYMGLQSAKKSNQPSKEVQILGYAQFRDDRMVGVLDNKTAIGTDWLRGRISPYMVTLDNRKTATVLVEGGTVRITPELLQDRVHFHIRVKASAGVQEELYSADLSRLENVGDLERRLADRIRQSIQTALRTMQEKATDNAGFGLSISRWYPRQWREHYRHEWRDTFAQSTYSIEVQADIINVGLTSDNVAEKEESY